MDRALSIDVFRGVTMFFMLWVNDFWTLNSIPKWLKHAASGEDYLGFSDRIFPWSLFAIGLSIPFAFESRLLKSETSFVVGKHIFSRIIALLGMGLSKSVIYSMILITISWALTKVKVRLKIWVFETIYISRFGLNSQITC